MIREPQDSDSSEQKMRSRLEARRGAPFTDQEWEEARRNLVGLFLLIGTTDPSDPNGMPE